VNISNFGEKFIHKGQTPRAIVTKLGAGRVSQVRTLTANFTVVALKVWAYRRKKVKIVNFWYKFAKKRYIPISNCYTI